MSFFFKAPHLCRPPIIIYTYLITFILIKQRIQALHRWCFHTNIHLRHIPSFPIIFSEKRKKEEAISHFFPSFTSNYQCLPTSPIFSYYFTHAAFPDGSPSLSSASGVAASVHLKSIPFVYVHRPSVPSAPYISPLHFL